VGCIVIFRQVLVLSLAGVPTRKVEATAPKHIKTSLTHGCKARPNQGAFGYEAFRLSPPHWGRRAAGPEVVSLPEARLTSQDFSRLFSSGLRLVGEGVLGHRSPSRLSVLSFTVSWVAKVHKTA
jgi:hypothetical protein